MWWVLAGLAIVAAIVSRIIVRQSAIAPRTPWDEISMLQMAKLISGDPDVTPLAGSGYYPGFSFLIAPVWWFTSDPEQVYQASAWVGTALALLTIWPLSSIARRLGLSTPQSLVAAAIVMGLPSRTGLEDYTLAEQSMFLFLVWTVAAGFRLWARPTVLGALAFALLASLTYLMHVRALVVLLVAGIWMVLFLRRRILPALVGVVGVVLGYFGVEWVVSVITEPLTLWGFSQGSGFMDNLRSTWFSLAARVVTAHLWAQLVATFGLIVIGTLVVVGWTFRELTRWRAVGPIGLILGLSLAGTVLGIVPWLGPDVMLDLDNPRFDAWQYTRYIDPYAGLLVLLALVAIFRVLRRGWAIAAVGIAVAGSLLMIFGAAPIMPTWGTNYGPGNAAGVQMWSWLWPKEGFVLPLVPTPFNANRYYFWASLVVVISLLLVLVLRRHVKVLALILIALATTGAIVGNPEHRRGIPTGFERGVELAEEVSGQQQTIDVDTQCGDSGSNRAQALNWAAFWFSPRDVDAIQPDFGDQFDSELVIACTYWERADALDALLIPDTGNFGYEVYILPGPLQDELAAAGDLVEPEGQ
ncbi:hypothetical protein ACF3NT_04785 [Naumannella halotolerans]|uniref:hypothetical protein n=1 Tax=Naumannella halotolerans TaxID=993414 RepID=UPI00370D5BC1